MVNEKANYLIYVAQVAKIQKLTENDYEEPKTFHEAWFHEDPVQRKKWREAIGKEFGDMNKCKVWTVTKCRQMP